MAIQADVQRIREVFGPGSDLRVPAYQRSFAWTDKETNALMQDLFERFESATIYFIGAIVLIQPNKRHGDIADGQQRLTTLTIILSVLRDLSGNSDEQSMLHSMIGPENPLFGQNRWRLTLNHLDANFFREQVQVRGATLDPARILAKAEENRSESQVRLARAVRLVHDELSDMSADERTRFVKWLCDEVSLVRVRVGEYSIAYKVFLVLNQRGLPLSDHDVMKSILFEQAEFPFEEALKHSARWNTFAERLGSQHFETMLKNIRFLYDRKMQGELIDGLVHAIKSRMSIASFIQDRLPSYVDAYDKVIHGLGARSGLPREALDRMTFLRSVHHEGWRAPCLRLLDEFNGDIEQATRFLLGLERLAYFLQYGVRDREYRAKRYRQVLDAMDQPGKVLAAASPLQLRRDESRDLVERLRGRFPNHKQRLALLRRINAATPGGEVLEPDSDSTVEHIFPRTPGKESQWLEDAWAKAKDREELTECIGNFTLLTVAENQEADRKLFPDKIEIFFRNGAPSHAMSADLRGLKTWTPDLARERRERLVRYMIESWDLEQ
jgi:hypothetical protein